MNPRCCRICTVSISCLDQAELPLEQGRKSGLVSDGPTFQFPALIKRNYHSTDHAGLQTSTKHITCGIQFRNPILSKSSSLPIKKFENPPLDIPEIVLTEPLQIDRSLILFALATHKIVANRSPRPALQDICEHCPPPPPSIHLPFLAAIH